MADEQVEKKKKKKIGPAILTWQIVLIMVVIAGFSSFYVVDETENAVITRFGKYTQTVGAGLHTKLPFGIDKAYRVPVKVVQTEQFGFKTVKGGRNNIAVRVNGFTSYQKPNIFVWENGEWISYDSSSVNGYDGYTVFYNKNTGLYDFSFVYTSTDPDREYRFKIEQ